MMPEYLYIITEILKKRKEESNYLKAEDVYSELSEYTKALYFSGEIEAYKSAVEFEINNQLEGRVIAKTFVKQMIDEIKEIMQYKGTTIDEISLATSIPLSVVKTIINNYEGSINNVMLILNHFGKAIKLIDWNEIFIVDSPEAEYTPLSIKPLTPDLYNVLSTSLGAANVPAGTDIGLNVTFNEFKVSDDAIPQIQGQLAGYNTAVYTNKFFTSGSKLLLTGVIDKKSYQFLLHDYMLQPGINTIYIGDRVITLQKLLRSLYSISELDTNRYFIIDIDLPKNTNGTVNINTKIPLVFIIDNKIFETEINLSAITYTPFTVTTVV